MSRPRVGISRCLLGDSVRWDGGHKRDDLILSAFQEHVEWVPVCPEVEVGMSTPREPVELTPGPGGLRMIGVKTGIDWTRPMSDFAAVRASDLVRLGLSGYILKAHSPSCGLEGPGVFARALLAAMPDLPVEDEQRLQDLSVREAFIERVRRYRG